MLILSQYYVLFVTGLNLELLNSNLKDIYDISHSDWTGSDFTGTGYQIEGDKLIYRGDE